MVIFTHRFTRKITINDIICFISIQNSHKCLKNNSAILIYIAALSYPIIVVICFSYKTDAFQAYMIFVFLPLNFNSNLHDHFDIIAYIVPLRTLFVVNKKHLQLKFTKQETITQPLPVYLQLFLFSVLQHFLISITRCINQQKKTTYFFQVLFLVLFNFLMCLGYKIIFLIIQH